VIAVAGTALAFVDLAVHRLLDRLTLRAFTAVATLLAVDTIWHHRLANGIGAIAGAAASAVFYLLLAIIADGGAGNMKLAPGHRPRPRVARLGSHPRAGVAARVVDRDGCGGRPSG
jgi:hypothetical protein